MTTKVVAVVLVCATALFPLTSAWAQVEHAQRVALEVAVRRAQVRALVCEQQQRLPPAQRQQPTRLPSSPPVGTAGPVDCSSPPWSFGR